MNFFSFHVMAATAFTKNWVQLKHYQPCLSAQFFFQLSEMHAWKMLYNWVNLSLQNVSGLTWRCNRVLFGLLNLILRWPSTAWTYCVCELGSWYLHSGCCRTQSFLSGGWRTVQVDFRESSCQILASSGISSAVLQLSEEPWENYGTFVGEKMRAEGVKANQLFIDR